MWAEWGPAISVIAGQKCKLLKFHQTSQPPRARARARGLNVNQNTLPALPNQPPEISGGGSNYAYGDDLDLNCTGKPTYPPTKLTWYINDIEARDPFVQESLSKTDNNLYYSETRLTIKVSSTQFQVGEMRIKCVASLIEEPIKADQSSNRDGIVLEVIKLPEAMKLQTENIFDGELLSVIVS